MRCRGLLLLYGLACPVFPAEVPDSSTADQVSALLREASDAAAQRRYADAEATYLSALRACGKSNEPAHCRQYPVILSDLGAVYFQTNRLALAESVLLRALKEPDDSDSGGKRGTALYNLAATYRAQARYSEAKPLYENSLEIIEKEKGPADSSSLPVLNSLALLSHDMGAYAQARAFAERAAEVIRKFQMEESPEAASTFAALGMICDSQGLALESEAWWRRSLTVREQLFGSQSSVVADTQVGLALAYRRQGHMQQAADLYQKVIAIYQVGDAGRNLPVAMNNLGRILMEQGNQKQAEQYFRRAIAAWEKTSGPAHPDVAAGLTSLGLLLFSMNQLAEAESVLQRAWSIDQMNLPVGHPKLGYDLHNLAVLSMGRKRYAEAERFLEQARDILEKSLPKRHPELGKVLARLGEVHHKEGDLEQSQDLYQNALEILGGAWGEENPALLPLLEDYSAVLRARKEYVTAASLDARLMKIKVKQTLSKSK